MTLMFTIMLFSYRLVHAKYFFLRNLLDFENCMHTRIWFRKIWKLYSANKAIVEIFELEFATGIISKGK